MLRYGKRTHRVFAATLVAAALALPAAAAACTLMKVGEAKGADLVVYFTKFESEDNTKGAFKKCRLVEERQADTRTFAVTPFRQDAKIIVHPKNWPR